MNKALTLPYGEGTTDYRGYRIKVTADSYVSSPREDDNLFVFAFYGKVMGDATEKPRKEDYNSIEELTAAIEKHFDACMVVPIYCYDHSGISISTAPFGCRWDSGVCGFAILTKETCKSELIDAHGKQRFTPKLRALAERILEGEVETYNNYINGEVYDYTIECIDGSDPDFDESCGGFYGYEHDKSGLTEYAQNAIECDIRHKRLVKLNQVKTWIRHRVPLEVRGAAHA